MSAPLLVSGPVSAPAPPCRHFPAAQPCRTHCVGTYPGSGRQRPCTAAGWACCSRCALLAASGAPFLRFVALQRVPGPPFTSEAVHTVPMDAGSGGTAAVTAWNAAACPSQGAATPQRRVSGTAALRPHGVRLCAVIRVSVTLCCVSVWCLLLDVGWLWCGARGRRALWCAVSPLVFPCPSPSCCWHFLFSRHVLHRCHTPRHTHTQPTNSAPQLPQTETSW